MTFKLTCPKYLFLSLLIFIGYQLNLVLEPVYWILGAIFILLNSLVFGHLLFIKNSWFCKFIFGFLFVILLAGLIGTVAFYFWLLNDLVFTLILGLIPLLFWPMVKRYPLIFNFKLPKIKVNWPALMLTFFYLSGLAVFFNFILTSATSESLRTPWEVLPPESFYFYFLATLILFSIIIFSKTSWVVFLISLHALASFSVAMFIYQIGFDYDPFIHQTNLHLILKNGTLLPKPFYYIGQYGIIIFLAKLLHISVDWLNKLAVPVLAAVYLPATLYYAFRDNFKTKGRFLNLAILTVLAFPFSTFISTTPQSLANLFFLITILLSLYYITHPQASVWPLGLLVLTTLAVHPLAGIPLLFFYLILFFYQHWRKKFNLPKILHHSILWELVILGGLSLPMAFWLNSYTYSQLKISWQTNWLNNILNQLAGSSWQVYYRQFISFTDLIYTYGYNVILAVVTLTLIGLFFITKHRQIKKYLVYIYGFAILLINFLLVKGLVTFFSLLSYEQQTYPRRILELSLYMLIPFIFISLYLVFKKIFLQKPLTIFLFFVMLSLALSLNLYLSYPRVDKIAEDHGYSTSLTDGKTVSFIDEIQKGQPYVVLASQPVSAAAISKLGFKYYYNGYFFYPVPTGEKLYQNYEKLAYNNEKTGDVIANVRYLTGVQTVYLVINDYWFNAREIIADQKNTADKWYAIDGKNYIFVYFN